MPILTTDIKLMESRLLEDSDEGGGAMSANQVESGILNNLFPDASRFDRTTGRVSLRKAFIHVDTTDNDKYYGAHIALTDPPDDDNVNVCAFTTEDELDVRTGAKNRVESYVVSGPVYPGFLFADHVEGVQTIQILQREEIDLPEIGDVLYLEGGGNDQYVRVTEVSEIMRTFTDTGGSSFNRRVVSLGLSEPLRYDFDGEEASRVDAKTPATQIRETVVADASKYYGVRKLDQAASVGDLSVFADSIFTSLVPSAQSETPIVDIDAGSGFTAALSAGGEEFSFFATINIQNGAALYFGAPVERGSVRITTTGYEWLDDGEGHLTRGGIKEATISYANGEVLFQDLAPIGIISFTVSAKPGTAVSAVSHSQAIPVTTNNRGISWVATLSPLPAPGSVIVDYMSQKKWYRLADNGKGSLVGAASGTGAGSIDYASGSAIITCGALPDADSMILIFWGGPVDITHVTPGILGDATITIDLDHEGIARNTVAVSWNDGNPRTLTDDGSGNLAGYGTGTARYSAGSVTFSPTTLPPPGTIFTVTYDHGPPLSETIPAPDREANGTVTITLANTPILPGTLELEWNRDVPQGQPDAQHPQAVKAAQVVRIRDNGSGGLVGVSGTVNYSTGEINFDPDVTMSVPVDKYEWVTQTNIFSTKLQPPSLLITI